MQGSASLFQAKPGIATHAHCISPRFQNQGLKARRASRQLIQAANVDSRQDLSKQLLAEIQNVPDKDRSGPPIPAVKDILDQMKQEADQSGYSKAEPLSSICGKFKQLVNTTDFVDEDRSVTLGAVTFQQIGPKDLKLNMVPSSGLGGLFQGVDAPKQYCVATPIKVAGGEHEGLVGISSVLGSFSIDEEKPHRQHIAFEALKIEPADTSPDKLKAWLSLMKEHNPTMDDDGTVVISFQQPIKGHRDFIYLDENVQVTVGNRGTLIAVERTS